MAVRVARSRAAAVLILLALALGTLVGVALVSSPSVFAIDEPTEAEDPPDSEFSLDYVPLVQTSYTVTFAGTAEASQAVRVEPLGGDPVEPFCDTVANAVDGRWECTVTFQRSGEIEVQAYREGGLFTDDFDRDHFMLVEHASFDAAPGPIYWSSDSNLIISGTKSPGSNVDVSLDDEWFCDSPWEEENLTTWECTMYWGEGSPPDGTYTLEVSPYAVSGENVYYGDSEQIGLIIDSADPPMASFTWPLTVGPGYREVTDALPRIAVSYLTPYFEGTGEPGATVHVIALEGDDRESQIWDYAWPVCDTTVEPDGAWACFGDWEGSIPPGTVWTVGTWQEDLAGNATSYDDSSAQLVIEYVEGPVDPVITSPHDGAILTGPDVTISGTGAVGDAIKLYEGPDAEDATYYCGGEGTTFPVVDGQWSCTIPDLPPGAHTFTAMSAHFVGYYVSGGTDTVSFTLVAPGAPTTPPGPTTTTHAPTPTTWTFQLTDASGKPIDPSSLKPGDRFFIYAQGLPPGASVSVELHSTPIPLGAATVDALGDLRMPVSIPADVAPGSHTVVATLTPPGGVPSTVSVPVAIGTAPTPDAVDELEAGAEPTDEPAEAPAGAASGEVSSAGASGPDFSEPSTIGSTLQTWSSVTITSTTLAVVAAMTVALIVLVALPAELLQSTFSANYQRAFGWLAPVTARGTALRERIPAGLRDPRLAGFLTVATTALVLCFADPGFGFSAWSLRLWLAVFASLFIVNVAAMTIVRSVARRTFGVESRLDPMPATILIVAASVLVSRLAHIEPGFLFGVVVGVVFVRELVRHEEGRLASIGAVVLIGIGLVSWAAYSLLPAAEGASTGVQFLRDFTAATTLEALSTLLIALLPLAFLDGEGIFKWRKGLWVLIYAAAVTAFVIVVVPMGDAWGDMSAPILGWTTLFLVFALFATGVWAYFRWVPERNPHREEERVGGPGGA